MKKNKKFIYNLSILLFGLICCSGFSFLMPFRIYFIVLFGIIQFFEIIKNGKLKFVKGKNLVFLILFCFFLSVSLFFSLDRVQTMKYLVMYLSILFMVINSYYDNFNYDALNIIELLCKIAAISIILNALIPNLFTNYLSFLIDGGKNSREVLEVSNHIYSGIMGEKAEASYVMVVAIIIGFSKFINKSENNKKNICWLILYFVALILPAKRMLFVIAVLITVFYILFWTNSKNRFWYVLGAAVIGLIGIFIAMRVPILNTLVSRFANYSGDATGNGRIYLWERAIEMFHNKPCFGYGYGTYNSYTKYHGVLLSSIGGEWNSHAHNIYYQMLGEIGIFGFLIFSFIILDSLIIGFKTYLARKTIKAKDLQFLFIGISILLLNLIYGYSGNPIYYTNQAFVFFWGIVLLNSLKYKYFVKKEEI